MSAFDCTIAMVSNPADVVTVTMTREAAEVLVCLLRNIGGLGDPDSPLAICASVSGALPNARVLLGHISNSLWEAGLRYPAEVR